MQRQTDIPEYFVYGEPSRSLDVGFMHVEAVMDRKNIHLGKVTPHSHPQMGQITFWTSGRGSYRIEDEVWDFSAPAVSFVPSRIVHGFTIEPDTDAIVVSIADDMLKQMAGQISLAIDVPTFVSGGEAVSWSRLATTLTLIADEYRSGALVDGKVLPGLIVVALSYIARLSAGGPPPAASPSVVLAMALRRAIDGHFREDWSVERYVEHLGTTRHLLDKAARQILGMPVNEAALERRVLEAKRLLLFTIRSAEDIGFEIGFNDAAYFSRFFRKRCGQAPAEWRKRHLKGGRDG